jgi:c(7)-type cytochrome triheme protein
MAMREMSRKGKWMGALLAAGMATAAGAALPRLPADFAFPQSEGSPGQVTFSHATHVDARAPSCLGCHPARFAILEKGRAVGLRAVTHEAMEKGAACGSCHGKEAFGFESCELCHKQ